MVGQLNGIHKGTNGTFLFTSESVGEGHPDKIAWVPNWSKLSTIADDLLFFYRDQVSDAVLDACLKEDPLSKVKFFGSR